MTKRLWALLIVCIVVVTGCITDSGDDGDSTGGSSETLAEKYVPLKAGASYTYLETLYEDGYYDDPFISDYTTVVGNQVIKDGTSYYTLHTNYFEDYIDTTYCRITDGILYTFVVCTDLTADIDPFVEVPLINSELDNWIIHTDSQMNETSYFTTEWTGKYLGHNSVTVPAGTFSDCILIKLIRTEDGYWTGWNGKAYYTRVITQNIWYAAGVGMVKKHETNDYTIDIDTYNGYSRDITITELTSYSTP